MLLSSLLSPNSRIPPRVVGSARSIPEITHPTTTSPPLAPIWRKSTALGQTFNRNSLPILKSLPPCQSRTLPWSELWSLLKLRID